MLHEFVIPDHEYSLIKNVHNSFAGHHGVERTLSKLKQCGHNWRYMREHVRRFVKQCPCCQKMSYIRPLIHSRPFTNATYAPFDCVAVDTVGPLPTDDYGNEYVIVVRETFLRVVGLYAVKI